MAKLTLNNIESGYASNTALNTNFDAIVTAIENTVSRDGTAPNTMSANLDMNGNQLLNIPSLVIGGFTLSGAALTQAGVDAANTAADAASALASKNSVDASEAVVLASEVNVIALESSTAVNSATASAAAAAAEASAAAAMNAPGADIWVTGTTYAVGDIVWSPINYITYRCKTAGVSSTDPSADPTNWAATTSATAVGTSFTPAGGVAAVNVQVAIEELDTEKPSSTTLAAAGGAALIGNTPAGGIAATTVQTAINELDTEKAALAGSATQNFAADNITAATNITATGNVTGANLSGTNTGDEAAASETASGIVELATIAEVLAGTDTTRAVTAAGIAGSKSLAASGYYKLPGGLVIQWKTGAASTGGTANTFPIAFSTACYAVVGNCTNQTNPPTFQVSGMTTTQFTATVSAGTPAIIYIAIGK